jgi:hypothetical protein
LSPGCLPVCLPRLIAAEDNSLLIFGTTKFAPTNNEAVAQHTEKLKEAAVCSRCLSIHKIRPKMKPSGHTFVISGGCSGLGLATALDLHRAGGYVSLLDLNAKNGERIIKELGTDRARFFETDVSDTKSLQVAVQGTVAWVEESSKPLAGVIAAAGVGGAAKVRRPCSILPSYAVELNNL